MRACESARKSSSNKGQTKLDVVIVEVATVVGVGVYDREECIV
jgi:hypothetical protein